MKDGEDEPSVRSEDASNCSDRTIEIVDVRQPMIAGDTVEGLSGQSPTRCGVHIQIRDAERVSDFGRARPVEQNLGDVDAGDSGATACKLPSDSAVAAGEIQNAHPTDVSEEIEQHGSRRLAADLHSDHIEVEVPDEVVAGRFPLHARHHCSTGPHDPSGTLALSPAHEVAQPFQLLSDGAPRGYDVDPRKISQSTSVSVFGLSTQ